MTQKSIFIVAVENSADQLGAAMITALKNQSDEDINFTGIGGAAMAACGVPSLFDIRDLSILGFAEALKSYGLVLKKVKQTVSAIMDESPDAVVLIDSWGFMVRVAKTLKKQGYKGEIIKYVAPQVWAMREGRARILAKYVDHLLTIHSFDAPYFTRHDLPTYYVGNSAFDTDYTSGNANDLSAYSAKINLDKPICALFFGSRFSELDRLWQPIQDAVAILQSRHPQLQFISLMSSTLEAKITSMSMASDSQIVFLPETAKLSLFAAADMAIACSGTVTSQLAVAGIPSVVAYKLNSMTWFAAKRLYKPSYVSLVNIAANEALMPEYLQDDATGENLAAEMTRLLENEGLRLGLSERLAQQCREMRGSQGKASERAAARVLDILAAA
ncbi:MAG: lipid-A-disaccharide synthase [Maricaulaceae bacterium]